MDWRHECSIDWMNARRGYLTASEIKSLIPITKTGRSRTVTDDDYLRVYANKLKRITRDDCLSYGVMARGHILEPYAIDTYNDYICDEDHDILYHWDDVLIPNMDVAFSPDALSIEQSIDGSAVFDINDYRELDGMVLTLGEIKCYAPDRHFIVGTKPLNELEERWQIATAMYCCPNISRAILILFNPDLDRNKMIVREFDRYDLSKEFDLISETVEKWRHFKSKYDFPDNTRADEIDVELIYKQIQCKIDLNP